MISSPKYRLFVTWDVYLTMLSVDLIKQHPMMSKEWMTKGTTELNSLVIVHEPSYNFASVIRSSFKNFPKFAGIIYGSCCTTEISAHWHPSSPYGCCQKETPRKIENQQLVSLSRQCFSTPVGFGQGFLSKEQCDNAEASSILSWPGSSWFFLFPRLKSAVKGRKDGAFVMLLKSLRMRRKSWKGFRNIASWNVSNTSTVAGRSE